MAPRDDNRSYMVVNALKAGTLFLPLILLLGSCTPDPAAEYRKWERAQVASGERSDSLFAGLFLGMSHDSFRTYSLEQHQAGRFQAGGLSSSSWVSYRADGLLSRPAEFNFYPDFANNRIVSLEADLYYVATASRDNSFNQDTLLREVLNLMDGWYGEGYFRLPPPKPRMPDLFVKVTDNRRLVVQKHRDGYMIRLKYTDLSNEIATAE